MGAKYYTGGRSSSGTGSTSTPKSYGGSIVPVSTKQEGVYYTSTGEYKGSTGGGVQPSRLSGSVTPYGGVVSPTTGQPTQTSSQLAQREAVLSKPTATQQLGVKPVTIGYQTVGGRTLTRVSATSVRPTVTLSEGFARRASEEGVSVSKPTTPFITQEGRTTRPTSILSYPTITPKPEVKPTTEKPFFYEIEKTETSPEGVTTTTYKPKMVKEYGGMIASTKPTLKEWAELRKQYGTWKTAKLFESKVLSPKIKQFFETTPEQIKAEKIREETAPKSQLLKAYEYVFPSKESTALNLVYGKPKMGTKPPVFSDTAGKTYTETMEQIYYGAVNEYLAKPITKVAPDVLLGAGFVGAETVALKGVTKIKPLFEAITTPTGQYIYKGGKWVLVGGWLASEGAQVVASPNRAYTFGEKLFEVPIVLVGARGGTAIIESQPVRRGIWGSPIREVEELAGIKRITRESVEEAFRTNETPVSKELREKTVVQIRQELREASDVVRKLRGKYTPEVEKITPTLLKERLGISMSKARRVVGLLEQYSPVLKGSFTAGIQLAGVRGSAGEKVVRDIDVNLAEDEAFEQATIKKGVKNIFDIHKIEQLPESATAQLEPLREAELPSGKRIKVTGAVEQLSRKVEGSIRFFNVEPKGATRAKDFPDVLKMKVAIEKGERKLFGFEKDVVVKKPSFEPVVVTPSRIRSLADTARWGTAKTAIKEGERLGRELELKKGDIIEAEKARMRWAEQEKFGFDWKVPKEKGRTRSQIPTRKPTLPSIIKISSGGVSKSFKYSGGSVSKPSSYQPSSGSYQPSKPPSPSVSQPSSKSYSFKSSSYGMSSRYPSGSYSYSYNYENIVTVPKNLRFGGGGTGRGWGKSKKLGKRFAPSLYGSTFAVVQKKGRKGLFSGFEVRGLTEKQAAKVWKF